MDSIDQIRQGDVLLLRREAPAVATPIAGVAGLRVPGERTGHAHTLAAEVLELADGTRLLRLDEPGLLTHDEHKAIEVPAGWWEPRVQREFVAQRRSVARARFD